MRSNELHAGRRSAAVLGIFFGALISNASILVAEERAGEWPPVADGGNTYSQSVDGRTIERFTHQSRSQWGYPVPQPNYFFLVHPKRESKNAPLCVVLHSANRTALDFLGYYFLNRKVDPKDIPSDIAINLPDDFYVLFLDSNNAEWWGATIASADPVKYGKESTPAEMRVLDTVEWVASKYSVDRNRIYLSGLSMGGCGSLGIGLPHGDIFAAVTARVPAGTGYVSCRMNWTSPPAADASRAEKVEWLTRSLISQIPDPPVVIDISAQNDDWSKDQAVLLNAAREARFPLILGWGPFGHSGNHSDLARHSGPSVVMTFPWFEIKKNEAYPVFTHATTDQRAPWINKQGAQDETGQINAYFRWKSTSDTPLAFRMQLWLDRPPGNAAPSPKESTADVTLRRLQQFKVAPNEKYDWILARDHRTVASGAVAADELGLLTIPGLVLPATPSELKVTPQEKWTSSASIEKAEPEVWIISGQSNACGGGELPGCAPNPRVQMWYEHRWVQAQEPLFLGGTHWGGIQKTDPKGLLEGGVGPWMTAANDISKAGIAVRLCGHALGGQPISYWNDDEPGWRNLSKCIHECGEGAGVFLWYQGESDGLANSTCDAYLEKLKALISKVRAAAKSPKMLVVIIQVARQGFIGGDFSPIREAQRLYVKSDPDSILITALGRAGSIHLSTPGYFDLGHEVARALLRVKYKHTDVNWPGPVMDQAIMGDNSTKVIAHFAEVKRLGGAATDDFSAQDADGVVKCTKADGKNTCVELTFERALKTQARLRYAYGKDPKGELTDEAGNRAPAAQLEIQVGPIPEDKETMAPNGAGDAIKPAGTN